METTISNDSGDELYLHLEGGALARFVALSLLTKARQTRHEIRKVAPCLLSEKRGDKRHIKDRVSDGPREQAFTPPPHAHVHQYVSERIVQRCSPRDRSFCALCFMNEVIPATPRCEPCPSTRRAHVLLHEERKEQLKRLS